MYMCPISCFRDGRVEFEHFEVIRTSQGYKVNVQNEVSIDICYVTNIVLRFEIML